MRYLLFSDVHANLPALRVVLRDAHARTDLAGRYHLGDLVGYAPWPDEVVALIAEEGIPGVAGNYDSTVATAYKHCGCRYEDARQEELSHLSYAWTLANTSAETKRFLGSLPFRIDIRPLGGPTSCASAIRTNRGTAWFRESTSSTREASAGQRTVIRVPDTCFWM